MKAHIVCAGCYEARIECAHLQKFLELNGCEIEHSLQDADLIVFYACGLTKADAKIALDVLKGLNTGRRPDSQLLVWGCLPKIDPKLLSSVHSGLSFGRREVQKLETLIGAKVKYDQVTANTLFPEHEGIGRIRAKYESDELTYMIEELNYKIRSKVASVTDPDIFFILTGRGCLGNCAYCADLHSCGRAESKPVDKIISEFREGLKQGFKRFHLITTDLGAYGKDLGYDLPYLLKKLVAEEGDYELLLPNVNPGFLKEMIEDLAPVLQSGKVRLIGIPVESGSNKVLEAMGRKYSVENFKECISYIRNNFPKILIWTQCMVSFPGETEEDFQATSRLLDEVDLDFIQVFKFSSRSTTRASHFENQVPLTVSLSRYRKLLIQAICRELSLMAGRAESDLPLVAVSELTP